MPVPYTPLAVANTFLELFGRVGIEHMKLQKLVYCSHGWWLANYTDEHLLDERPQVWKHGPVFSSLYSVLKPYGRASIFEPQSDNPFIPPAIVDGDDENVRLLVQWIWGRYGHLSSFALSDLTHKPGTPWSRVANEYSFKVPLNTEIPDDYIREEFQSIMRRERSIPVQALRASSHERRQQ